MGAREAHITTDGADPFRPGHLIDIPIDLLFDAGNRAVILHHSPKHGRDVAGTLERLIDGLRKAGLPD